ncbi:MAG: hypothetical protein HYZ81_17160 [Nitrospinae bacterium]|nr:hypothetical protein [Nitrospinota bacterium]
MSRLESASPRSILVIGASDTGKTTLIEQMLDVWNPGEPIAVVDCDVGQSRLGPPTTIGWGVVEPPTGSPAASRQRGWSGVVMRGFAFTGAVSPEGNVEVFLDALSHMLLAARREASKLIIDTTGLVTGDIGALLKSRKVALVQPDLVLALQRERELEEVLACVDGVRIERLMASSACTRRSLEDRTTYRNRQLARYFVNSARHGFSLRNLRVLGLGPDWPRQEVVRSPAALIDRMVGLRDAGGKDLALGLLREYDPESQAVTMLTPLKDASAVTTLAIGSVRWPEDS